MKREAQLTIFLLILAAIFGLYARLAVPVRDNFPLLDGGLFYAMARDLLANDFHWPLTTSYNQLDIPFAYPPLGIFLLAWLHRLSGVNLLVLMRWIPALVSLLTLPMVYLLARQLLESAEEAALATLLFATLPRAYEWIIMGGGVTRAPGTLFYIAFAWAAYQAFSHRSWKMAIWAGLFGGLVVLTHPERALHAAAAGLLFWLWLERSRQGTLRALLIGGGTLLVSAPWWGTVLTRYGGGMLTLAAQAGGPRWLFWAPLLQLDFTDEILPLTALLAIYGAFLAWKDGQRLLPVWFVLVFFERPTQCPACGRGADLPAGGDWIEPRRTGRCRRQRTLARSVPAGQRPGSVCLSHRSAGFQRAIECLGPAQPLCSARGRTKGHAVGSQGNTI